MHRSLLPGADAQRSLARTEVETARSSSPWGRSRFTRLLYYQTCANLVKGPLGAARVLHRLKPRKRASADVQWQGVLGRHDSQDEIALAIHVRAPLNISRTSASYQPAKRWNQRVMEPGFNITYARRTRETA